MVNSEGKPLRVAFVVQRYGREINGGAEQYCRDVAEHLLARPDVARVKVFTTCARDHGTWSNHYPTGVSTVDGVEVERFAVLLPRLDTLRVMLGHLALRGPRLRGLELPWLIAQGPFVPELVKALRAARSQFDAFVFMSYLYYPTVLGLPRVQERSLFVPTTHDEPPLRMRRVLRLFQLSRAIAFLTPEERELASSRVSLRGVKTDVVGCGLSMEPNPVPPERRDRPYILYIGRIEAAKGVGELVAGFRAFKQHFGQATFVADDGRAYPGSELDLVLAGRGGGISSAADVVTTGFVSDERRWALLKGCEGVIVPGLLDSLSLSMLEAWVNEKAVLVPDACPVKRGHVLRSGAGALYGKAPFHEVLASVLADREERARNAKRGADYVRENYTWSQFEERFMNLVKFVAFAP